MSEIYRGSTHFLYLDLIAESADALPTATVQRDNDAPQTLTVTSTTAPSGVQERYKVTVGLANTQAEGSLKVVWNLAISGVPVVKTEYYDVITPYLDISEVKAIFPEATDDEAVAVEASVRLIINAHCGQSFGFAAGKTVVVEGHGGNALRLPQRLISVSGVSTLTANLDPLNAIITSDGWYLKKGWTGETTPLTSTSTYWTGFDTDPDFESFDGVNGYEKSSHGPVTRAPGLVSTATPWKDDYPFTIVGDWGYKTVPANVKEAARLLVNDYACMEIMYRDRYLKNIQAADWSLEFSSQAWESTGNVRADQLLDEYVILDWVAI